MTDVEAAIALDRAEQRWLADARERLFSGPPAARANADADRAEQKS